MPAATVFVQNAAQGRVRRGSMRAQCVQLEEIECVHDALLKHAQMTSLRRLLALLLPTEFAVVRVGKGKRHDEEKSVYKKE